MTTPAFDTLYPAHACAMLTDAHRAITTCNLWDWIQTYEPEEGRGFMFSRHPNLERINAAMLYTDHSGSSYGWTMRVMESIAKKGWDAHKSEVRRVQSDRKLQEWAEAQPRKPVGNPCPCRAAKGFADGWCGVAGGGVPACDH